MTRSLPVVLAILNIAAATRVEGQRLPAQFPRFRPRLSSLQQPDTAPKLEIHKVKDYTWEGAAIGGLALGVFGAYFARGMCGMDDQVGKNCTGAALSGFLGGATIGATLGGILGSQKKKAPRSPPADSALNLGPEESQAPVPVRAHSALFPRTRTQRGDGLALGAVLVECRTKFDA